MAEQVAKVVLPMRASVEASCPMAFKDLGLACGVCVRSVL